MSSAGAINWKKGLNEPSRSFWSNWNFRLSFSIIESASAHTSSLHEAIHTWPCHDCARDFRRCLVNADCRMQNSSFKSVQFAVSWIRPFLIASIHVSVPLSIESEIGTRTFNVIIQVSWSHFNLGGTLKPTSSKEIWVKNLNQEKRIFKNKRIFIK